MKITHSHNDYSPIDWQDMTDWFATPLGDYLLQHERRQVQELLKRRFGYHLLQLGCAEMLLHDSSPMGHKFSFCPHEGTSTLHTACARGEAIPLGNESVDLVLLHHALDFSGYQHQLLREVARVLIAGGSVVIVGFNPFSAWGVRALMPWSAGRQSPWNASPLSARRLTDWLKLLDFQVDQVHHGAYALPVNSERSIRWSGWMEAVASRMNWPTGGYYIIHARKQVIPLTPVQRRWRKLPMPAMGLPLAEKISKPQPQHQEHPPLDP
jgi:SAM-dependent methyltransferase